MAGSASIEVASPRGHMGPTSLSQALLSADRTAKGRVHSGFKSSNDVLSIARIFAVAAFRTAPFKSSPAGVQVEILFRASQVPRRGAAPGPTGSSSGGGQQC